MLIELIHNKRYLPVKYPVNLRCDISEGLSCILGIRIDCGENRKHKGGGRINNSHVMVTAASPLIAVFLGDGIFA